MAGQAPVVDAIEEDSSTRPRQRFNWGFVPIPKRCQWDPAGPPDQFRFTMFLNVWFGLSATLTVANSKSPSPTPPRRASPPTAAALRRD